MTQPRSLAILALTVALAATARAREGDLDAAFDALVRAIGEALSERDVKPLRVTGVENRTRAHIDTEPLARRLQALDPRGRVHEGGARFQLGALVGELPGEVILVARVIDTASSELALAREVATAPGSKRAREARPLSPLLRKGAGELVDGFAEGGPARRRVRVRVDNRTTEHLDTKVMAALLEAELVRSKRLAIATDDAAEHEVAAVLKRERTESRVTLRLELELRIADSGQVLYRVDVSDSAPR